MENTFTFGVSVGNGNDGVSQMYPCFYVNCTEDQAFDLAERYCIGCFIDEEYAKENVIVDGEANYTISAMVLDPKGCPGYSEHNGAFLIVEVFKVIPADVNDDLMMYESLEEALGKE